MANKRKHKRYTRRLKVDFMADGSALKGISSDFSMEGLFIRSSRVFPVGTFLDMTIHLPDGKTAGVKGVVARSQKRFVGKMMGAPVDRSVKKDGMGVVIVEKDVAYLRFLSGILAEKGEGQPPKAAPPARETRKEAPVAEALTGLLRTQTALIRCLEKKGLLEQGELKEEMERIKD
ncbi:MAG: PilZ domain-containing protein [Nitrospirota bacterium]|jgi:hypothetical protein